MVLFNCFGPCRQFPPSPPYRQFEEAQVPEPETVPDPEPSPEPTPPATDPPAPPIRALWFKEDSVDQATAEAYLHRSLQQEALAQATQADEGNSVPLLEFNGISYQELIEPNTALISRIVNDPGVNVWVRGFGGNNANGAGTGRYADISEGGAQVGFEIPLSHSTRIGLFGTYASMQGSDGSRGSWDADGWGGGGYAEYWSDNFYLRGMLSAGSYGGEYRRSVDGDDARGDRNGHSWTGAISVGAPFDSGDWILEPQALVSYTNSNLDRFSEGGIPREQRLRYDAMGVDNVDTELTFKVAYPIRDGQRSLFMPSLRLGWVADWGNSGDGQTVTFLDSGESFRAPLNSDANHGALVEVGLDYTTFNFSETSMGVYARTGLVAWGGERGTSWQVQGGLNFRF